MAYIYKADVWCDDCGKAICERLKQESKAPADPSNESSYDSDDYPKRAGDHEESDTPQHCAAGADCLNAIELPGGTKVGLLFGELTRDGIGYVKDAIVEAAEGQGDRQVVELWQQYYWDKGYSL